MKSFTSTYTFSLFDKEFHIKSLIKDIRSKMNVISKEDLELSILDIEKTMNIPFKKKVLDDYNKGNIIIYTTDASFNFPATIPILIMKDDDTIKAIINMTSFISYVKDEETLTNKIKLDNKKLFSYMCTAWLYKSWMIDDKPISNNGELLKVAGNMYAKFIYKVLDKRYSIGLETFAFDYCGSLSALFFAKCVAGASLQSSISTSYSIPSIQNIDNTSDFIYKCNINKNTKLETFEDLCKLLNNYVPKLSKVDPIIFISEFSRIWNGSVVPAIDFFPYFAMMIFSAYIGGNIGKDLLINATAKSDITDFVKIISALY